MQDDTGDTGDRAAREGIADAAGVCVVGGCYSGYATLRSALRYPER